MPESIVNPDIFASEECGGIALHSFTLPVLVFGPKTKIYYANQAAADALGYTPEELTYLQAFDISPDLNLSNWEGILTPDSEATIHFRKKDWKLIQTQSRTLKSSYPDSYCRILIWDHCTEDFGDSDDLKQFHHNLSQPEKLARLSHFTLQRASDALFWINSKGEITHVNEASCRKLGYTRKELTSLNILDINKEIVPERLAEVFQIIREQGSLLFESNHYTKEGKAIKVEISSNYINFDGEEYTCSIVRDITERKRKEAALRGALEEIKELRERLQDENNYLQEEIKLSHNFGEIISQNKSMRKVLREVEQVAHTQTTVLIMGESGTGKELIARDLHQLSPRSDRPMIKVNCAALPTYLIESELFGHEKGAFTGAMNRKRGRFELADKGTIFLDEIGEMPVELQAKLLRVLQEGEFERLGGTETLHVNARIIAATNRNLEKEVEKGNFREDLYYRLNVFPISCPPLRDRKEDIPLLVRHFCQKMEPKVGKKITHIPQKVLDRLQEYHFPGNIRELENIIERAVILSRDGKLQIGDWIPRKRKEGVTESIPTLDQLNRQHIVRALKMTNWKISGDNGAAKLLGLKPTTLESRMKKMEIRRSTDAD